MTISSACLTKEVTRSCLSVMGLWGGREGEGKEGRGRGRKEGKGKGGEREGREGEREGKEREGENFFTYGSLCSQ